MSQPRIVIVDYDCGNIDSVRGAIEYLGYRKVIVSNRREVLAQSNFVILPGVGSFGSCVHSIKRLFLDEILHDVVRQKGTPMLGICLGMQLLANYSEEGGRHQGLGWVPGHVEKLALPRPYAVPHVGWNDVITNDLAGFSSEQRMSCDYYFDHSYHFKCDTKYSVASVFYGEFITAVVQRDNVIGVQFHPEKSGLNGLRLLRRFFTTGSLC